MVHRGDPSTHVQVDADLIWRAVLSDLKEALPVSAFEWLRHTRLTGFADDDVATVQVADRAAAETLQRRYAIDIERKLSERVGRPIAVALRPEFNAGTAEATPRTTSSKPPRESRPAG